MQRRRGGGRLKSAKLKVYLIKFMGLPVDRATPPTPKIERPPATQTCDILLKAFVCVFMCVQIGRRKYVCIYKLYTKNLSMGIFDF